MAAASGSERNCERQRGGSGYRPEGVNCAMKLATQSAMAK